MTTALFRGLKSNTMDCFADINHQYIDIHHTKRQTEITLNSCSIMNLKTRFKFIS